MKKTPTPPKFSSKNPKNRRSKKSGRKDKIHDDDSIIFGLHAVIAALQNPVRKCQKLTVTKNALNEILQQAEIPPNLEVQKASPDQINKKLSLFLIFGNTKIKRNIEVWWEDITGLGKKNDLVSFPTSPIFDICRVRLDCKSN